MRFAGWEEGANPDFPCDRRRLSWLPTPADGVLSTVSLQPTQYSWLPAPTDVVLSTVFIMADGLPLAPTPTDVMLSTVSLWPTECSWFSTPTRVFAENLVGLGLL